MLLKGWLIPHLALDCLIFLCFSGVQRSFFKPKKENDPGSRLGKGWGRKKCLVYKQENKLRTEQASEWLQAHWVNKWRLSRDNPFVFTVVAQCSQRSDLTGNPGTGFKVLPQAHCSGPTNLGLKGPGLNGLGLGFLIRLIVGFPAC